jgi:hypothetical protein
MDTKDFLQFVELRNALSRTNISVQILKAQNDALYDVLFGIAAALEMPNPNFCTETKIYFWNTLGEKLYGLLFDESDHLRQGLSQTEEEGINVAIEDVKRRIVDLEKEMIP